LTPLRALIVEDSADDAELLVRELRRHGYAVHFERAWDAETLDRALSQGPWDIVFSDHSMPTFGSGVALQMVRMRDRDVPFLIVSGTMGEDAAVDAMRAGANDYLVKGRLMRLAAVIERELRQAAARSARRRVDETLEALRNVSIVVGRLPDPRSVAAVAVKHLREVLRVDAAALFAWDPESAVLRVIAREGLPDDGPVAIRPGDGADGIAFQRRELFVVERYQDWPGASPRDPRVRSVIAAPLLVGDRAVGVIEALSYEPRSFDQSDRDFLQLLAADVASPLETARLYAEAERERALAEAVAEVARLVAAGAVTTDTLTNMTTLIARALSVDDVGLFIPIRGGERFELLAGTAAFRPAVGRTFASRGSIFGRALHASVPQTHGLSDEVEELNVVVGAPITLAVPVMQGFEAVAVLAVSAGDGAPLAALVNALQRFVALLATALENSRLARESAARQAELEHLAHADPLTDLPNRAMLRDQLTAEISRADASGAPFAVLHLDLVHFKDTNNAFGAAIGDALLREIGPRLEPVLGAKAVLARVGGDDFAAIIPSCDATGALQVAREAQVAFERPLVVGDEQLAPRASFGIAVFPQHGRDPETLLRRAEVACDAARRKESAALYSAEYDDYAPERLSLIPELRRAIDRDELVLHYQPIISVRGGDVVCVEALVRWQHPDRGLLGPGEFLPLAERAGLMKRLTLWVTAEALRRARRWHDEGLELSVAVNLSVRLLHDPDFPNAVRALLLAADAKPDWLIFEITESEVMADPEGAMAIVERLREMRIRFAIDDFGTGYSSLTYLHRLAVHTVKIDRSFVTRLNEDENSAAIVRATVELGHSLGLDVVAEGVEDGLTLARLASLACDRAQGFHIAKAMPAGDVARWIDARRARARAG